MRVLQFFASEGRECVHSFAKSILWFCDFRASLIGEEFFVLRDTMVTNVSTSVNIPNFDFEDDRSVCKEDGMEHRKIDLEETFLGVVYSRLEEVDNDENEQDLEKIGENDA